MRVLILAIGWAAAIMLLAVASRFGWLDREAADLLLMVMPMIAFVTLLGDRNCRLAARSA
jgi:hypothetical protein